MLTGFIFVLLSIIAFVLALILKARESIIIFLLSIGCFVASCFFLTSPQKPLPEPVEKICNVISATQQIDTIINAKGETRDTTYIIYFKDKNMEKQEAINELRELLNYWKYIKMCDNKREQEAVEFAIRYMEEN